MRNAGVCRVVGTKALRRERQIVELIFREELGFLAGAYRKEAKEAKDYEERAGLHSEEQHVAESDGYLSALRLAIKYAARSMVITRMLHGNWRKS